MYHPVTSVTKTYNTLCAQDLVHWETSFDNEMGRLVQGVVTPMKSVNEKIFLSNVIRCEKVVRSYKLIQYVIYAL